MSTTRLSSIDPDEQHRIREMYQRFATVCLIAITCVAMGVTLLQHLLWSFLNPVFVQAYTRNEAGSCGSYNGYGEFTYANCDVPEVGATNIGYRFVLLLCVSLGIVLLSYMWDKRYGRNCTEIPGIMHKRIEAVGFPVFLLAMLAGAVSLVVLLFTTTMAMSSAMF